MNFLFMVIIIHNNCLINAYHEIVTVCNPVNALFLRWMFLLKRTIENITSTVEHGRKLGIDHRKTSHPI